MNKVQWINKYQPKTLSEVIGQEEAIIKIRGYLNQGIENMPNLLFHGEYGVGKSSTADCLVRELSAYREYIDCAANPGVDQIRNLETSFHLKTLPTNYLVSRTGEGYLYRGRIIILDEADSLSKEAQNSLGSLLDIPQEHTKVIAIVNFLRKKDNAYEYTLLERLVSRMSEIQFTTLDGKDMEKIAHNIMESEKFSVPDEALSEMISRSMSRPRELVIKMQDYYASTIEAS